MDFGGKPALNHLVVELRGSQAFSRDLRAEVDTGGRFYFDDVRPGQYELRLVGPYGGLITRDMVLIAEHAPPLVIRLPQSKETPRPKGVVSLRQLRARTSRDAVKEFARASKASRNSDRPEAIRHLERAVAIAPDFLEAHNNRGVQYLAAGRSMKAVQEFRDALRINPQSALTQANLALALYAASDLAGAEAAAKQAMSVQPDLLPAHYALALVFEAQARNTDEALQHLAEIANRFPQARLVRARMLARAGRLTSASVELERYLATGTPEHREQVNHLLNHIKRITQPAVPPSAGSR